MTWDDDWDPGEFISGYQARVNRARRVCTCRQMDAGICEYCDGSLDPTMQDDGHGPKMRHDDTDTEEDG